MLTRDEIKAWLKRTGRTRQDLAAAVGLSKGTVNNWLSGADPIPAPKQQLIERLMKESDPGAASAPATPSTEELTAIALMMTREQRAYLTAAARRCGQTLEEFILTAAIERAERAVGKFNTSQPAS